MTEMYAVSIVAEHGFVQGCSNLNQASTENLGVPKKCSDAIRLLGTCSKLIAEFWYVPDREKDGNDILEQFNLFQGLERMHHLQGLLNTHMLIVKSLCHMSDADF